MALNIIAKDYAKAKLEEAAERAKVNREGNSFDKKSIKNETR